MAVPPNLRVLFFDVFGTCVAQRTPVADELWKAAQEALKSEASSMNSEVRTKTAAMQWNKEEGKFLHSSIEQHKAVDWKEVDQNRIDNLPKLLLERGLIIPNKDPNAPSLQVSEGSLWNESQLQHLARIWHRLPPWPDTNRGLSLLNKKFSTVTLSNTYKELLDGLVENAGMPFTERYSADMFHSYKPNPKVYLGAAEKMGVKPEECALVAAHLGDLKAAKACGFYAIYVERKFEERHPEWVGTGIEDLWIKEGEDGFIALAARLGITEA